MSDLSDDGYVSQTDREREEDSDLEVDVTSVVHRNSMITNWNQNRNRNQNRNNSCAHALATENTADILSGHEESDLSLICGAGAVPMDTTEPDDDKKDVSNCVSMESIGICLCPFLQLPSLVRETMYLYLSQKNLLSLRSTCIQLMIEVDNFADFNVHFRKSLSHDYVPIPFPHLKFLTVDNPHEDLPWFFDESRPKPVSVAAAAAKVEKLNMKETSQNKNLIHFPTPVTTGSGSGRVQLSQVNRSKRKVDEDCQYEYIFRGTIGSVKLVSIHPTTLQRLAYCRTIKEAIIATDVFERKIPQLHWQNLTYLRLHFYIVRFVGSHELEMLENFDAMCSQTFPKLKTLKICLRRSYLNPQSSFSIRSLRFMSRHWRTLRDMTIEMEAEKCDLYPQTQTPEFTPEELENLKKVQLTSLKIDATELLCQKCRIWQDFIRQQKSIESLKLSIYAAHGHPVFFYPVERHPSKTTMKTMSIGLWGLHGHFPIDFRRLTKGVDTIYNIRLFRSPTITVVMENQDGPEILNMSYIPHGLVSLTIKGFTVASGDVDILLKNTPDLTHLTLKNAGYTGGMGMNISHIQMLLEHPSLATACVDINNPVRSNPDESYDLFLRRLENGRLEFKIIGSRESVHTFLFIDRERARELLRLKHKHHDDDVLPGLDYPMGFINRFDNWKIRS